MTSALVALYQAPLATATGALTGFLVSTAAGVLAGGRLADFTTRHDRVAAAGVSTGAALMLLVGSGGLRLPLVVGAIAAAGFAVGLTAPSRDMLVRAATPPGAAGRVFGFVYSGLDLGSSTGPLLFGWLLDRGHPRGVFVAVAAGFLLCAVAVHLRIRAAPRAAV
jgi:MFS family permease